MKFEIVSSLRAQRSNLIYAPLDCFVTSFLAMTPRFDDAMTQGKRTTPKGFGKW